MQKKKRKRILRRQNRAFNIQGKIVVTPQWAWAAIKFYKLKGKSK